MKAVFAILIGLALIAAAGVILIRGRKRRDRLRRRERRKRWLADRYIWDVVMRRNSSRRLTYRKVDDGE